LKPQSAYFRFAPELLAPISNCRSDSIKARLNITLYFVLPDSNNLPTHPSQSSEIPSITVSVGSNFISPKRRQFILPGRESKTVPEITINEHSYAFLGKYQIWSSWEVLYVFPEPEPQLMQL